MMDGSTTKKLKVINLFASPGAGKSTTAAGLFNLMKCKGHSVELVTEFAKDLVWSRNFGRLEHQLSVLAEQDYRLRRLSGQVDVVITDSPIPLQTLYMGVHWKAKDLDGLAWDLWGDYDNFCVRLNRVKRYDPVGRMQTEEQATAISREVDGLCAEAWRRNNTVFTMDAVPEAPRTLYSLMHGGWL